MFKQARLKLTIWYLLIITIISLSFSALIYKLISLEINRFAYSQRFRIEQRFQNFDHPVPPPPLIDDDLIVESQKRLLINLTIINGVILVVSGSLSYFLAGQTLRPIQQMTEEQKRFISDASHELKTPLTGLKTLFEVSLRDKNLKLIEAKNVIKKGLTQTNQLQLLSESLLELNYLDSVVSLNLQSVSVKKIINEAVKKIKPKADSKKIEIKTKAVADKVKVDQSKIEELVLILLDNAIKYSPQSSQIKLTATKTDKNIILKVIDQGRGISESDLPHIFDRFYQANQARTKNSSSGYGLGLCIAKTIVKQHHGQIEVKSRLNKGSEFKVVLPT